MQRFIILSDAFKKITSGCIKEIKTFQNMWLVSIRAFLQNYNPLFCLVEIKECFLPVAKDCICAYLLYLHAV